MKFQNKRLKKQNKKNLRYTNLLRKLQALGERNKVESEEELRKKRVIEFNTIFNEKKSELER